MADFSVKVQTVLDTDSLKRQLSKAGGDATLNIKKFAIDKASLKTQLQNAINNTSFTLKIGKVDFGNAAQTARSAGNDIGDLMAKSIQSKLANGGIEAAIARVTAQYERLGNTGHSKLSAIKTDIEALTRLQNQMSSAGSTDALVKSYESFNNTLTRVKNGLSTVASDSQRVASALQISNLDTRMAQWLQRNTGASREFRQSVMELRAHLDALSNSGEITTSQFKTIEGQFRTISNEAIAAGNSTSSFAASLKDSAKQMLGFASATAAISTAINMFKNMSKEVLAVDTSLTGLYRVTDLTAQQYKAMYKEMVASAKEYGATLTEIIDGTTTWVKLGFSPADSQVLSEITAMYQHVTDLDVNTATRNLVTAYKGFEQSLLQANNGNITAAVNQIADIYDALGNKFAESAAEVGDGLSKAASVLQEGGASIQEAAGMFTGMQEVMQDSSKAGSTLKILTLRIRGKHSASIYSNVYALHMY